MHLCHHCGRELRLPEPFQRTDGCPYCHSDLKVCLNCTFFDRGVNNPGRHTQAEWQTEEAEASFCEFFDYRQVADLRREGGSQPARDARAAFDSLFKKK